MTAAEKQRQAERMRAAWQAGKFANRPKGKHPRNWSAHETARLRALAGQMTPAEIAETLSRETGLPRTENAVIIRLQRLGLSRVLAEHSTAQQVAGLFGVDPKTVTHSWVRRGWLTGRQQRVLAGSSWTFTADDLERFIRAYGWVYDWQRMRPGRWRALAEVVAKADPWHDYETLRRYLGIAKTNLDRWNRRGLVPHERRSTKDAHDQIMVRGRDFAAIKAAIERARHLAKERAREATRWRMRTVARDSHGRVLPVVVERSA